MYKNESQSKPTISVNVATLPPRRVPHPMFGPAVNNPAKITIPHSGLFTNIGWKTVHTFNRLKILLLGYNNDIFAYLSDSSQ